jgi:hypothetical protein
MKNEALLLPKISYAETFDCIDCGQVFRKGMDPETDMYLNAEENKLYGGHRCIYCYNLKSSYPCPVEWFIEVADRLEHENEIKAFLDLYITFPYSTYTDQKYRFAVQIDRQIVSETEICVLRSQLVKDGMKCGEIFGEYYWHFTVDFADHERMFTR